MLSVGLQSYIEMDLLPDDAIGGFTLWYWGGFTTKDAIGRFTLSY